MSNGSATFVCATLGATVDTIDAVQWLLNGTLFEDLELQNVAIPSVSQTLRFTFLPVRYNQTRIKCRATFVSGHVTTSRTSSLLLIQGLLKMHIIKEEGYSTRLDLKAFFSPH